MPSCVTSSLFLAFVEAIWVLWHYLGAALEHLVLALCFVAFLIGAPERAWSVSAIWRDRLASARRVA
jgi:hypothetical protein